MGVFVDGFKGCMVWCSGLARITRSYFEPLRLFPNVLATTIHSVVTSVLHVHLDWEYSLEMSGRKLFPRVN